MIKTVRFKVYTMTDDDGTGGVTTNVMTSSTGTLSNVVTLVTDPDGTGGITTTQQLARLIPAAPTFGGAEGFTYDAFGEVNGSWTAPGTKTDGSPNLPNSIGGYRIDVSDDGMSWRPVVDHTRKTKTEYMYVEEKKEDRRYRVFAWHGQYLGQSQDNSQLSEFAAGTDNPSHVTGLRVTAVSPSQIDISWNKLTETGSSPLKEYEIYGVKLDTSASPPTFAIYLGVTETTTATQLRATSKTESYSHTKRSAGATWKYRVIPVGTNTEIARPTVVDEALEDQATTPQATVPEAPEGLVAEDAKSSNLPGASNRGVLLMWNAPGQPDGATITSYRIQRNIDDGAWETLVGKTTTLHTDYTDTKEWKVGEMRMYRVAAFSGNTMGAWATVAYPAMHTDASAHVMATGTLDAQNVAIDAMVTVDASAGFTGDMLMYSVMSSDDTVAMATVDEMSGMVTITGVADGTATITVTATDSAMATAMQTIAVTVPGMHMEPPAGAQTAPSIREPVFVARGLVEVEWTPGDNNGTHIALLWDEEADERVGGLEYDTNMNNREAFLNVPAGTYSVAVISYNANGTPKMTFDIVTGLVVE